MRLYLDAPGGVAGDMFAAAMLDAWPELGARLDRALETAGLHSLARITREPYSDGVLTGTRLRTEPAAHHSHRPYAWIRDWLAGGRLEPAVTARAQSMFRLLAEAEAQVHGIDPDAVAFHEVGAWDSIADIVSAAWLIEATSPARWHAGPLPMGRGIVHTAHGALPVPAPATALLLQGFPLHQDEIDGERITPTGAVILRHLAPDFAPLGAAGRLLGSGIGFGSRRLPGRSNILRLLRFDDDPGQPEPVGRHEKVAVCVLEIDDQSSEDLAAGLEELRSSEGVLDVLQLPAVGKKGRLVTQLQVLCRPERLVRSIDAIFRQTSTLGVRWQVLERRVLERESVSARVGEHVIGVKRARRPGGETRKAELGDVVRAARTYGARERVREAAEQAAGSASGAEEEA